jgi:hypothetical protein
VLLSEAHKSLKTGWMPEIPPQAKFLGIPDCAKRTAASRNNGFINHRRKVFCSAVRRAVIFLETYAKVAPVTMKIFLVGT